MLSRTLQNVARVAVLHARTASQVTWRDSEDVFLNNCHHAGSHSVMTSPRDPVAHLQKPRILHAPEPTSKALLDTRSGETLRLDSLGPIVGTFLAHYRAVPSCCCAAANACRMRPDGSRPS